jgi:polysaccharide export outer membrane protein
MHSIPFALPVWRCAFALGAASVVCAAVSAQTPPRAPATPAAEHGTALAYRITRGDVLAVAVFGEAGLTIGGKKVEARGTINLQLIQDIRVAQLTLAEAKAAIENAYREGRFLRNPEVTVSIEQYAPRIVSISGKVNSPGQYPLPPEQAFSLKDLILRANGFAETARGNDVRVVRTMPDGSLKTFEHLDVASVIRGKDKAKLADANFQLEPDDLVYVPERIF